MIFALILVVLSATPLPATAQVMCFKTGEQVSGMNRVCYYSCAGSTAAITVGVSQLCPLSIRR